MEVVDILILLSILAFLMNNTTFCFIYFIYLFNICFILSCGNCFSDLSFIYLLIIKQIFYAFTKVCLFVSKISQAYNINEFWYNFRKCLQQDQDYVSGI